MHRRGSPNRIGEDTTRATLVDALINSPRAAEIQHAPRRRLNAAKQKMKSLQQSLAAASFEANRDSLTARRNIAVARLPAYQQRFSRRSILMGRSSQRLLDRRADRFPALIDADARLNQQAAARKHCARRTT
jgi:hypothetical protein